MGIGDDDDEDDVRGEGKADRDGGYDKACGVGGGRRSKGICWCSCNEEEESRW